MESVGVKWHPSFGVGQFYNPALILPLKSEDLNVLLQVKFLGKQRDEDLPKSTLELGKEPRSLSSLSPV